MFVRFLHPDLGIGGAERLILDCALALDSAGHRVELCTNHWSDDRRFPETVKGSKFHPKVYFSWVPRHLAKKCFALLAYTKMILAACVIALFSSPADVLVVDQVSACIPFFQFFNFIQSWLLWRKRTKVLFYCHWPDQLLSKDRESLIKRLYRGPLDWFERVTTKCAHKILVNSNFTAAKVARTFNMRQGDLEILYPALDLKKFENSDSVKCGLLDDVPRMKSIVLSINRYERKKNVKLAIQAVAKLPFERRPYLIIAGGYDPREQENVTYKKELEECAESLKIASSVKFCTNITDGEKVGLLGGADCLIYTPMNEHFGIVPLEAMACGTPVVAMKSGGPLETVPSSTGLLVDHGPGQAEKLVANTAEALDAVLKNQPKYVNECKQHIRRNFSFEAFQRQLDAVCLDLVGRSPSKQR